MIGGAAKLATFPLRRRLIGAGIMLVGVFFVGLGFFVNLTNDPVHGSIPLLLPGQGDALRIPLGSHTAAGILQHAFDHPLFTSNTVRELGDAATRAGVVAMAAGAAVALLSIFVPPLRGFAGLGAGLGLAGDAAISGVLFGENTRITADFANPQIHVDLGVALWVFAAGFAMILVGGALAAWRPLAGLFTGISLAITGAGLGAALAVVLGGNHLLGGH
ncbi:MAG TPA: hypothetical protein VN193_13470 [Candidatus Angelobacter sp.]|jgi:hypothetical protein|nr:hypothetical protein [Candidatus Angelobacter sp.]